MGLQYNAYPFDLTLHVAYVLKKICDAHDDWGYAGEPIYLLPYNDGFSPTRSKDYNLSLLFHYLCDKKVLEVIPSNDNDFYNWVKTPIVSLPKMRVSTRWKIKILDLERVRSLQKLVEVRVKRFNDLDLRCNLTVTQNKLYLVINHDYFYLKRFNNREAKDVFRRLTIQRVVERDADGFIKGSGIGSGMPIGSLVDVVRNAGFKKKSRSYLFHKCEKDIIEMKSPAILDGEEINRILDDFILHNSKNDKSTKTKNRETWPNISSDNPFLSS